MNGQQNPLVNTCLMWFTWLGPCATSSLFFCSTEEGSGLSSPFLKVLEPCTMEQQAEIMAPTRQTTVRPSPTHSGRKATLHASLAPPLCAPTMRIMVMEDKRKKDRPRTRKIPDNGVCCLVDCANFNSDTERRGVFSLVELGEASPPSVERSASMGIELLVVVWL